MKNKYKIDLNPPKLNDEQIAQHMDFEAILAQAQVNTDAPDSTTSRPTRWLYYLGGAVAAGLLGFFVYQSTLVDSAEVNRAYFAEKPFIDPPFKAIKANYIDKKVNANQGGIFEYENGSRLIVPAAAFIDDQGVVVEGEVDIRYREFHDFVDFFLSGIPMTYDSAGTTYQLESAGMVEIYAEKNGKKINVAPGKKIDVELVSEIMVPSSDRAKMPKFNVYELDTEKRNWVYTSPDNIEFLPEEEKAPEEEEAINLAYQENLADLRQQEQGELNTIESSLPRAAAPVRPERANGNDFSFDFEFNNINGAIQSGDVELDHAQNAASQTEQEIQNLRRQYEGTLWQVSPNNTNFDQKVVANINWEDMKLNRVNNREYELTLISGSNQMKVLVNPVLMGADYENAIQEFNQQFEAYEQKMATREAQLAEQKAQVRQRYEQLKQEAEDKYEAKIKSLKEKGLNHLATDEMIKRKIINRFQATNFGIWNCDRPFPPFLVRVNGEFKDDSNNEFNSNTAFLVNQSRNTVCRFKAQKGAKVNFNTDSDNLMWLITPDNKLALFRPEKFRKINQKEKDFTFVMNVVDKAIETEDDVRKILEF